MAGQNEAIACLHDIWLCDDGVFLYLGHCFIGSGGVGGDFQGRIGFHDGLMRL